MRRRPDVKLYLEPAVVTPGQPLVAEAVLTSKSETPIEYVEMKLHGNLHTAVGAGETRREHDEPVYGLSWRSRPAVLTEGEHRFRVEFPMHDGAPPTYEGADASIAYALDVHVSIPWWPDRRTTFSVPVKMPPITPGPNPRSAVYATSSEGPRGEAPFMEVAIDATDIALGDVVSGRISLANLSGASVRGIDLSFVEMEAVTLPSHATRERSRFRLRVLDGQPVEDEAIPFRVRVPESALPSFVAGPLRVSTHLEVRAVLAWASDIVVRAPLSIAPAPRPDRAVGRVEPVGRERMFAVWQAVAQKLGFVVDASETSDKGGLSGLRGPVQVHITSDHRDGDFWIVAELSWPSVGLDLDVSERSWRDALAIDVVKTGVEELDRRLTVHAREHLQAKPFVDAVAPSLVAFEQVRMSDEAAHLASRGSVHSASRVDSFVTEVLRVADAIDAARPLVGPPMLLASAVPAWKAFAESIHGRLELGRMWIHGGRVGTDSVAIGCTWGRRGLLLGTTVHVTIDPPLVDPPTSPDDPAVSPAARDAWRLLLARAKRVTVRADLVYCELEGKLDDPATALPVIEAAVALKRALGGAVAAGPFR